MKDKNYEVSDSPALHPSVSYCLCGRNVLPMILFPVFDEGFYLTWPSFTPIQSKNWWNGFKHFIPRWCWIV